MQSNRNKVKYLRDTAKESNAPFLVLTETHLKPHILSAEVKIDGYSLYRSDRGPDKSHGGVAIYQGTTRLASLWWQPPTVCARH